MTDFWSLFVIVLVVGNVLGICWLLFVTGRKVDPNQPKTTGHAWDGIEELNNPLPRWWLGLFVITLIFGGVYLVLYPGLGAYSGILGWSQQGQYQSSKLDNEARREAFYAEFKTVDIKELASNPKAMASAARLFATNCSTCHGSDGGGAKGFPNLTDDDWLYGNDPATLVSTLVNGRAGIMPDLGLNEADVVVMAHYVQFLSGQPASDHVQREGQQAFAICAACHGSDAKGNQALGAPKKPML